MKFDHGSTIASRQRRKYAACKVFAGYTRKIFYILFTEFQVLERLHRGPKFLHDYLIGYIITHNYLVNKLLLRTYENVI